jgi:Tol biopolymer transport system component
VFRCFAILVLLALAGCSKSDDSSTGPGSGDRPPIRIAFLSERPPSPTFSSDIYFYDASTGGHAYPPSNVNTTNVEGPCGISGDGKHLAFFSNRQSIGTIALLFLYDVTTGVVSLPHWTSTLQDVNNPSLSRDGRYLAFQYTIGGADIFVGMEDLVGDNLLPLGSLNEAGVFSFDPSLNADGTLIAFSSNRSGAGGFDIFLYSVPGDSLIPLPGLNSPASDLAPAISGDGRYIAFQSGRVGQNGGVIDVFLYDRQTHSLVPLPGANTALADYLPSLSPDGRYLVYTTDSVGGRDIRVYDIGAQRLLDLPGLNDSYYYDYFPSVADH